MRAVFLASQATARHMTEDGRIITIGSALTERVPADGMTVYAMCKAALTGLTRGRRVTWARAGSPPPWCTAA